MLHIGLPEKAKIGEIHYLCYREDWASSCKTTTAALKTLLWVMLRNLHIIKKAIVFVDILIVHVLFVYHKVYKIKSRGSPRTSI